ncbi:NAD(P)H-dependent oxidoreductase [Pokkaliibacter sp. MBI-7]|uniref:NADPH-dependent FMN reductase n=1 Tax=Pokkaliibacter sp. MBI-7 TaxID=3040600 RepID=UPI0024472E4D|nr:NAD(P)H-dependent oxidoreductase [Pokkaliibacter sp. MBI-7]MDH2433349.1 NAD(P)H-dependent oxidoreductase [Pokkaliibacter sp. MBI-7]
MSGIRLLALSGSLRRQSYNTAVLTTLAELAPSTVRVDFPGLGQLPLFNPDEEGLHPQVVALEAQIAAADGLLIASPEYAHGISGVLKNALDWLVGGAGFVDKPIALFNTSPRASHAQAALRDVLTTMSGQIVERACVTLPLLGTQADPVVICAQPDWAQALRSSLREMVLVINSRR